MFAAQMLHFIVFHQIVVRETENRQSAQFLFSNAQSAPTGIAFSVPSGSWLNS
jgi:hypothetical protein